MIRINLALMKRPSAALPATGGSGDTRFFSMLKSLGVSSARGTEGAAGQDEKAVLRNMAVVAVMWFVLDYTLTSYRDEELARLDSELGVVQTEKQGLEAEVGKRADYEKERIRLEAEEKLIQAKVATLDLLSSGRETPQRVLDLLSSQIPADVWLSDFQLLRDNAVFAGFSDNRERVTDFMSQLDRSPYFFEAAPNIESQVDSATGANTTRFELKLRRRTGNGG